MTDTLPRDPRVVAASDVSGGYEAKSVREGLRRIADELGWSSRGAGAFGGIIPAGARVLIKPNWVRHANDGPWGIDPLLTHTSIIRATVEAALESGLAQLAVGDAPLQSCDFDTLISHADMEGWARSMQERDGRFRGLFDFRRTRCVFEDGVRMPEEERVPMDQFVLFDLGHDSLLEPITDHRKAFRVTQYDPRLMSRTHGPGRHQYLISRHVVEADVVINLPKLKTHRKAGVTCALKNLIGINGNKEYLPHHRIGGSESGGDCYPGASGTKRMLEWVLDRQHTAASPRSRRAWNQVIRVLAFRLNRKGDELGVDGAWSGNDTIWRTCLDLNRILLYGRPDGTLADEPQRRVVHLTDAVIAGQGDGPLAPEPLSLGLLLGSWNAPAMDRVGGQLLGYDPDRIPITRESFGRFHWPISAIPPEEVVLVDTDGVEMDAPTVAARNGVAGLRYPPGWRDAAPTAATP